MTAKELLQSAEEKMKKALEVFQEDLKTVRTGRANPEVFKRVRVECYGSMMSLSEVAGITAPDGRSFMVQPFDKNNLKAIEQAIQNSDLGFNPSNDGTVIRISVPTLSEDRRKELIKQVGKMSEERGRIPVRNIRRDTNDQLKKLKGSISEDELKKAHEDLEKLTSKYVGNIDELTEKKDKELQTV
jgi:ribosome recycling factor